MKPSLDNSYLQKVDLKGDAVKTIVVVAVFLFQFKFSHFVKSESQFSLVSYTIQQIIWFKTKLSRS